MKKDKSTGARSVAILTAALAVVAAVAVFFAVRSLVGGGRVSEPETYSEQLRYASDGTPVYPDVEKSPYDVSLFSETKNGRMTYGGLATETGVDVSEFQEKIDWEAVAADGITFAYIRAGYRGYGENGRLMTDAYALENIKGAREAGLKVGVYFYSQAITEVEAQEEAKYLLRIISGEKFDLPVMYDWENYYNVDMRTDDVSSLQLTRCALAFCERLEARGYDTGVYYNLSDAYERYDLSKLTDKYIWFAQYDVSAPEIVYKYDMWQYTSSGEVDGINGSVDLNIMLNPPE